MKWTYAVLGTVLTISAAALFGHRERVLLSGSFHSVVHKGAGEARVVAGADGRRILRLGGVKTYPGNDLQVCLVGAPDAEDNDTVRQAGFECLGKFAATGSYELPAGLDLKKYRAVTIWSRDSQVNFTTAPLAY
jgi:hypothetical protein